MKFKKYLIKTLTVIAGSIISAYGITLAIGAGFGGATLAILWQGLTNVTGMTIGTSSLVVAVAMIIFALFYDKKQINVGTSLAEKNGWKIKIVRMVLDILMVVIGVLLGGKFGICTVATVLLSGPVIQATVNAVKKSKIFKTINDNI